MYASRTRKEKFSGPGENCQRNVTDLAGSLVTSCRPPGRLQTRPDDRTSNAGVAVRTADGSRRTADAADEQYLLLLTYLFLLVSFSVLQFLVVVSVR